MSEKPTITYRWKGVFTAKELAKHSEVENIPLTTQKANFVCPQQELVERARAGLEVYHQKEIKTDRHRFSDAEDKTIMQKYLGEVKTIEELARLLNVPKIAVAYRILYQVAQVRMVYNGYDGPFIDRETKKEDPHFKRMVVHVAAEIRNIIEENKNALLQRKKNYSKEKSKWANIRVAKNISMRRWVFNRDGNGCIACGSADKLVLEHIIPVILLVYGGAEVKDAFAPFNLATLCKECSLLRHRPRKLLWDEETLELLRKRRELPDFGGIGVDLCAKYGIECGEAFIECVEDDEKLFEKYPNCEGCPYAKSQEKQGQEEEDIEAKFQANLERIKKETKARRDKIEIALSDSWNFYSAYPEVCKPTGVVRRNLQRKREGS